MANIFVIVVTYNGRKWYEKCFGSLKESTIPVQIIVVDNASTDNTVAYIKKNYPEIYLIENNENLGFGRANNRGMEYAVEQQADYILLLNQDAYIEKTMISKLVDISILNPEYGVLSPIQLNGEKDDFDLIFSFYVKKYWNYKSFKTQDFSNSLSIFPVKFVMAAIWLLPIICIKKVGGFDPAFSHYGEDNDYVNRVYFHNYKVGVCPSALGYHDRKKRVKTNKQQLFFDRLACYIILKNINYNGFTSLMYFILICIRILMRYLLKLKLNAAIILLKEYVKILTKYPLILKERKLSRKEKAYLNVSDSKEDLENAKLIKELQDIEESEQVLSQEEFNKSLNL